MKRSILLGLGMAGLLAGCETTDNTAGSALPIAGQDSSAIVPGNAPIENRMGIEGTGHYHRKVITPGTTP